MNLLDSSFNPPTLAHLALARALAPPLCPDDIAGDVREGESSYDACLLSIQNADKPLKPGDATHLQRLEMMSLFAQDILQSPSHSHLSNLIDSEEKDSNVAIAIISALLFADKSTILLPPFGVPARP